MEETKKMLPLRNVVACLSGYTHETKNELHQLIESLGGKYTRELNLDKNTHLITEIPQGAKYELASANPQTIHVVSSSWLQAATTKTDQPPLESDHGVSLTNNHPNHPTLQRHHSMSQHLSTRDLSTRLHQALEIDVFDNALNNTNRHLPRYKLFQHHQFYLLGFDNKHMEWKQKVGTLIRRAGGTIYWELNENVTMLILCDGCDTALFKAAQVVSEHHPYLPPSVSPWWVVESYQKVALQPPRLFPPVRSILPTTDAKGDVTKKTQGESAQLATTASNNSSVFRGCLFSFLRTSVDEEESSNVLEFDPNEQAAFVKAHGGQLLSRKLVDALRADARKHVENAAENAPRCKCYVVCWGGGNPRVDTSPLVAQLQRDKLCDIVLVTPLWVQTCVTVRKRVRPERVPLILMPQVWSMKSLVPKAAKKSSKKEGIQLRRLDISLTGFQGTEKAAIIHLIGAVGGLYHDHMSSTNTHLICKDEATGIKLEKALQWGLHIVSIKWLYHVLQHGYGGIHNEENGCEEHFSVGMKSDKQ
jgi:hypothetical protein